MKILSANSLKKIFFILAGTAIYSFGLVHFNMQNHLAEGGFTGISLLFYFLFSFNPAVTNLLLNIPVFFLGWKFLGRKTFIYTIIGTLGLSFFLEVFQRYQFNINLENDMTLAALFAGVFIGLGLGITFRSGGTTGGVDIIARLAHKYFGIPIGRTIFVFDVGVIVLSVITYLTAREGMYTLVAIFIGTKIIDIIQEGTYSGRGVFIVSDYYGEIAEVINKKLKRGVTIFEGEGHYTKRKRKVIYCVVSKRQLMRLKNEVTSIDPNAFVTITYVSEVLGHGFTLDHEGKPIDS